MDGNLRAQRRQLGNQVVLCNTFVAHLQNDCAIVMGRKAWLFSDTPRGADASAKLYSLVETAKACGLEPYAYLKLIFEKLPQATTLADIEALLPWAVKAGPIAKPTR